MVSIPALQYLQLAWDDRFITHPEVGYPLIGFCSNVALFFVLLRNQGVIDWLAELPLQIKNLLPRR